MAQLINNANAVGKIGTLDVTATSRATVELYDLWFEKTASSSVWSGGNLTYNIVIENRDLDNTGTAITELVFTDTIAPTIATLVANSVFINGTLAVEPDDYTFNTTTGLLTISLDDIPSRESTTISFQIERV